MAVTDAVHLGGVQEGVVVNVQGVGYEQDADGQAATNRVVSTRTQHQRAHSTNAHIAPTLRGDQLRPYGATAQLGQGWGRVTLHELQLGD